MSTKLKLICFVILFELAVSSSAFAKINIIASVDNEIITNYDVLKESRYLKVLNPNLDNLSTKQITELAKDSLIKEIIKRNEILKFISLEEENSFVDEYMANLFIKLGYKDKKTFNNELRNNETYSLDEVKLKIKIELFWNDLIFNKYINQIIIDEKKLGKKIDNLKNKSRKEFFLSEIIFKKNKEEDINDTIFEVKKKH